MIGGKWVKAQETTQRELRQAHNLMKLYMDGGIGRYIPKAPCQTQENEKTTFNKEDNV